MFVSEGGDIPGRLWSSELCYVGCQGLPRPRLEPHRGRALPVLPEVRCLLQRYVDFHTDYVELIHFNTFCLLKLSRELLVH